MALINYFSVVGKSPANDGPLATGGASAKAVLAKVVSVTNANKRLTMLNLKRLVS